MCERKTKKGDLLSSYKELKEKYKAIGEKFDKAINENTPWEKLLDELISCVSEMEETPEAKEQRKRLEKEVDQWLKQLEKRGF